MNSTKFKIGKFYKQKFGTSIGFISPMLAQIVMENLEKSVFERLGFVVPFLVILYCLYLWIKSKQL